MSETRHPLHSVSDLYAADEIEVLLLEEIRDLEPPPSAYSRPEDIQDFEIAGSRTGGRRSSQSSELESPGVHSAVHSWDSHANYHGPYDHKDHHGSSSIPDPWPRARHVVLRCDLQGHLRTAPGIVRLLLLVSSAACLATLCSSGTAKVGLFMLPQVGRLRLMIFVAVLCMLVTALLLFLDISHVVYLFPLNWAKLNAWVFTGMGLSYVAGSSLLCFSIWEYSGSGWVPRRTRSQLTVAAALGLSCALLALLLSWLHVRTDLAGKGAHNHPPAQLLYRPVDNSSSSGVTLKERSPRGPPSWVGRNQQQPRKSVADPDATNGNGSCGRYKPGGVKKDHWASAKQHFLRSQAGEEEEEEEVKVTREEVKDRDGRRRRRRRKRDEGSWSEKKREAEDAKQQQEPDDTGAPAKPRCVPRKLPLKTLNVGRAGMPPGVKLPQLITGSGLQTYWGRTGDRLADVTSNGLPWEAQNAGMTEMSDSIVVTQVQAAAWASQWQPPSDDVQPCSSKAVDPYTFP